jgi:hypothetical protein
MRFSILQMALLREIAGSGSVILVGQGSEPIIIKKYQACIRIPKFDGQLLQGNNRKTHSLKGKRR